MDSLKSGGILRLPKLSGTEDEIVASSRGRGKHLTCKSACCLNFMKLLTDAALKGGAKLVKKIYASAVEN